MDVTPPDITTGGAGPRQVERRRRFATEPSIWLSLAPPLLGVFAPMLALHLFATDATRGRLASILWGSWVSPLILWAFAATLVFLLFKQRLLRRERRASMLLAEQLLPRLLGEVGARFDPIDLYRRIELCLARVAPRAAPANLLLGRCRAHLLRPDDDTPTTTEDIVHLDRDDLEGSYTLARFTVWAVPILGFIGTVLGISGAVAAFSDAMQQVTSAAGISEALQDNLPGVTSNLATAFDTTFLALLLSLPLMWQMSWLHKREENYIADLDRIWATDLLPRLRISPSHDLDPQAAQARIDVGQRDTNAELRLLSAQVHTLNRVMRELHETLVIDALRRPETT